MRLEELKPNASVNGVLANGLVTVVNVQWFGSEALVVEHSEWHDLFTEQELNRAKRRLRDYGYDIASSSGA